MTWFKKRYLTPENNLANLKDIKPSISELSQPAQVDLILASRSRREQFYKKPDKRANKKMINKLSQEQKQILLDALNKE